MRAALVVAAFVAGALWGGRDAGTFSIVHVKPPPVIVTPPPVAPAPEPALAEPAVAPPAPGTARACDPGGVWRIRWRARGVANVAGEVEVSLDPDLVRVRFDGDPSRHAGTVAGLDLERCRLVVLHHWLDEYGDHVDDTVGELRLELELGDGRRPVHGRVRVKGFEEWVDAAVRGTAERREAWTPPPAEPF